MSSSSTCKLCDRTAEFYEPSQTKDSGVCWSNPERFEGINALKALMKGATCERNDHEARLLDGFRTLTAKKIAWSLGHHSHGWAMVADAPPEKQELLFKTCFQVFKLLDQKGKDKVVKKMASFLPHIVLRGENSLIKHWIAAIAECSPEVQVLALTTAPHYGGKLFKNINSPQQLDLLAEALPTLHPEALEALFTSNQDKVTVLRSIVKTKDDVKIQKMVQLIHAVGLDKFPSQDLVDEQSFDTSVRTALESCSFQSFVSVASLLSKTQLAEFLSCPYFRRLAIEKGLKPENIALFKSLIKQMGASAAPDSQLYRDILGDACHYGSLEGVKALFQDLSEQQRSKLLAPDTTGKTLLHLAAQNSSPEVTLYTLSLLGKGARSAICSVEKGLGTPLDRALEWKNLEGTKAMLDLLSDADIAEICSSEEATVRPLQRAASRKDPRYLTLVATRLKKAPAEVRAQALSATNRTKSNAFHAAAANDSLASLEILGSLLPDIDKESRRKILLSYTQGFRRESVMTLLCKSGKPELIQFFAQLLNPDELKQALQAGEVGIVPPLLHAAQSEDPKSMALITDLVEKSGAEVIRSNLLWSWDGLTATSTAASMYDKSASKRIVPLLDYLNSDWELATALGKGLNFSLEDATLSQYLKKRFPKGSDRIRFLQIHRLHCGRASEKPSKFLEDAANSKEAELLLVKSKKISDLLPSLAVEPFRSYRERLQASIKKAQWQQREELQERLREYDEWMSTVFYFLSVLGDEKKQVLLARLFNGLQSLADPRLRDQLTQVTFRGVLSNAPFPWSYLEQCLSEIKTDKRPKLYLLPLCLLAQNGVDPELLTKVHRQVQSSRKLQSGHQQGKVVLRALTVLSSSAHFSTEQTKAILIMLLDKDTRQFVLNCRALSQIIDLGKEALLLEFLGSKNLSEVAAMAFQEVVPLGKIDNFASQFAKYFGEQRNPEALTTYAGRISCVPETLKELGEWITHVLTGSEDQLRYSPDSSKHMQALHQHDPKLLSRLKTLCNDVKPSTVQDMTMQAKAPVIDLSEEVRNLLYLKIVTDKHLDARRFPHLFRRLQPNQNPNDRCPPNMRDSKLEEILLNLLDAKTLTECSQLFQEAYKAALALEKKGSPIGEFQNDLKAVINNLSRQSYAGKQGDWQVSVTDNYLDLFLIGTDIDGSCQRVDGFPDQNKCLMGYVTHGKTFAIVIKEPGKDKVVARRMLHVELDKATGRPALFLERLYSNYPQKELDSAITGMAKTVAARLKMPLYALDKGGQSSDVTLESKGCSASWVYSDAGGGPNDGCYTIRDPKRLYQPQQAAKESSSSSSSSSC